MNPGRPAELKQGVNTTINVEADEWKAFRMTALQEGLSASELVRELTNNFVKAREAHRQGSLDSVIVDASFVYLPSLMEKPTVEKLSKMSDEEKEKALRQGYIWMKNAEAALRKSGYSDREIKKIMSGEGI